MYVPKWSNWYAYCENNPVMFVDPWGLDSIVFVNEDMVEQAYIRGDIYTEYYDTPTYVVPVNSTEMFVNKWNTLVDIAKTNGISIDVLEIICHGSIEGSNGKDNTGTAYSTGFIYFTNEKANKLYAREIESMKVGDFSVGDLASVFAKELHINACNSANPDTYNIVYGFMQRTDISNCITGFDGGSKWNGMDHVRGDGEYGRTWKHPFSPTYYVKKYQHSWWSYVEKNEDGSPARERIGRRTFLR